MMDFARSLLSNLATLTLAFVLALIIWLTATQTQDPMRTQFVQLPVDFIGQPEDAIRVEPERQTVQIRVEGPESVLRQLSPTDFTATVDLSEAPFGETVTVPIDVNANISGVTLSTPAPDEVEVLLEQQVTQRIPVELDIRGSVARGHTQGEALIEPEAIVASGPASRLEQIEFALVTVFLNNARETTVTDQRPIFYDQQGRVASTNGINLSTEDVEVTIPVEESAGFAEKLITVNWIGEPAPGYRLLSVNVDPPSVLVKGLPARVNALTRLQTEPIDITGLTQSFTQQATLDLPAGISLDQDQEIFVEIEVEPILTTDIVERQVELLGLGEEIEASVEPEQVRVVLFGPLPVLDTMLDEDVRVTVDLFNLDSGTYNVEPNVVLPDRGLELRSIQPSVVTVVLTRTMTNTGEVENLVSLGRFVDDVALQNLITKQQHADGEQESTSRPPLFAAAALLPASLVLRRVNRWLIEH